ncbi:hypothetical protein FLONG3_6570 [Fusarium longipes]|uniref:Uncharacterized protein n=1 Tax=Fusarium longipes TaxID=694270 RepID=A0A395SK97_9HYPO|nr:hypothetical protein FLONG3_6570 [Fusarium longipes]
MGNFGAAVASLLDTYTKCLSILKGVRNHNDGISSDTHSTLSTSLRSDRARVRRAYVSRLSKDGSRFEKGDTPARSALRRIVKKLTTTLDGILGSPQDGKNPLEYESARNLRVAGNGLPPINIASQVPKVGTRQKRQLLTTESR